MQRYWFIILSTLLLNSHNGSGQESVLHFNQNGEFKIVQLTDTHIIRAVSESIFNLAEEIVELEKPDLVVITGDITVQDSIDDLLLRLATIFADRKIHWVSVFGNHDDEFGLSRKKLNEIYHSLPYNLNSSTPEIKGETNFILPVTGDKHKVQALLYFFDSNAYNPLKDRVKSIYGWIEFSQINWYRNQSNSYTRNNEGVPFPALSFFHIPLPEYKLLWDLDSVSCIGSKHEDVSCPLVNSGLYLSMIECGDIMGVFTGHDHNNDYIGKYNNIALAYGRFSGSKNAYGHLKPGARVIILKEDKREFDTWIREKGGNIMYKCQFPDSFVKQENQ